MLEWQELPTSGTLCTRAEGNLVSWSLVLCCENITKWRQIEHWRVKDREGLIVIFLLACSVLCKILLLCSENSDFWSIQNFTIKIMFFLFWANTLLRVYV